MAAARVSVAQDHGAHGDSSSSVMLGAHAIGIAEIVTVGPFVDLSAPDIRPGHAGHREANRIDAAARAIDQFLMGRSALPAPASHPPRVPWVEGVPVAVALRFRWETMHGLPLVGFSGEQWDDHAAQERLIGEPLV